MRNLVVYEALNQLAVEAAERLAGLVATGEEIAFEVTEEPGGSSPLYCYRPLTAGFLREHSQTIYELPSFGSACSALAFAGAAVPYLAAVGAVLPPDPRDAACEAILAFLAALWRDSTGFSLEGDRFDQTYREFEGAAGEGAVTTDVIAPVIGLQLPVDRLELAEGLALVRSDVVDVPAEARRAEGQARTPWEPQVLATVTLHYDPETPAPVSSGQLALQRAITALRLFKAGGAGLGPHGWTRTGDAPWRRLVTGAARPRGGGYWLTEDEIHEFAAFAGAIAARPVRAGNLGWAIRRFEMGVERRLPLEGLSDHLLAMKALLDGGGVAGVSLPARVAALCADPAGRHRVQAAVERAFSLERTLMRGVDADIGDGSEESAEELAGAIEDQARAILRDAAAGHLGNDLRATADEILAADGFPPPPEVARPAQAVAVLAPATSVDQAIEQEDEVREDWMAATPLAEKTMEWPVRPPLTQPDGPSVRQAARHLFPVPDTTEWPVQELPRGQGWQRGAIGRPGETQAPGEAEEHVERSGHDRGDWPAPEWPSGSRVRRRRFWPSRREDESDDEPESGDEQLIADRSAEGSRDAGDVDDADDYSAPI